MLNNAFYQGFHFLLRYFQMDSFIVLKSDCEVNDNPKLDGPRSKIGLASLTVWGEDVPLAIGGKFEI